MVDRAADLGGDSPAKEGTGSYREPWSRTKSLLTLAGMVLAAAVLTLGGILLVRLTIVWQ